MVHALQAHGSRLGAAGKEAEGLGRQVVSPCTCSPARPFLANTHRSERNRVGKVDADSETEIGERYAIEHYPTLKIFEAGSPTDYKGDNSLEALTKFALDYKAKPRDGDKIHGSAPFDFAAALNKLRVGGEAGRLRGLVALVEGAVKKVAGDSLGTYTLVVWLSGFFAGVLAGILFALREKQHLD